MDTARGRRLSRRAFLRSTALGGSGLLAAYLLGCGDDGGEPSPTATTAAPTATSSAPPATEAPLSFTWRRLGASGRQPAPRRDHSLVAASFVSGPGLLLFGGRGPEGTMRDLWRYDFAAEAWTQSGAAGPPARFGHNAVWDAQRGRMAVFGGQAASGFFNDLWSFDPAAEQWAELAGDARPAARYGAAGAVDPAGRFTITHGFTSSGRFDDTWRYDLASAGWTDASPGGARPIERCLMRAVWDTAAQRLLMFGGQTDATPYLGDLWALTPEGWSELTAEPKPSPRKFYAMAFDPALGAALLFGGDTEAGPVNDLWLFDSASDAWSQTEVSGEPPSPRSSHDAAWVPERRSLVVFGGRDASGDLNELWELAVA